MVQYKLVKIIIDAFNLVKVIINILVFYHSLSDFFINNRELVFILKC